MTVSLMSGAGWRRGYLLLGAAQLALAAVFTACLRVWPAPVRESAGPGARPAPLADTLRLPAARLGALAFFLYLGVEATAGAWLYSLLEEGRGASMGVAGSAVSVYWGSLLAGRVAFGFAPERWQPDTLVRAAAAACALAAGVIGLDMGTAANFVGIALLGFAAAPIFPALIGGTPARVGPAHASNAVGIQVAAAALGQAGLPAIVGVLAARAGLAWVPVALLAFSAALLVTHAGLSRASQRALSAAHAH
jgi:fucose permease